MPRTKPTGIKRYKAAGARLGPKKVYKARKTYLHGVNRGLGAPAYAYAHEAETSAYGTHLTCLTQRTALTQLADATAWGGQYATYIQGFPRAAAMMALFQEYRIVRMDVIVQPSANVSAQSAGSTADTAQNASLAYVQAIRWVNAAVTSVQITDLFMSELGVTPTMFNKEVCVSQKPVVSSAIKNNSNNTVTNGLMIKASPWIACTMGDGTIDTTTHFGPIVRVVQQPVQASTTVIPGGTPSPPGFVQLRLVVEFRKPAFLSARSAPSAQVVPVAQGAGIVTTS